VLGAALLYLCAAADARGFAGLEVSQQPAAAQEPPVPGAIAVADFDADGDPDIARLDRDFGHGTRYRIGIALGWRRPGTVLTVAGHPALALAAIDVDHDRDVDLVVRPLLSSDVISVLLNNGRGQFAPGSRAAADAASRQPQKRSGRLQAGHRRHTTTDPKRSYQSPHSVSLAFALQVSPAAPVSSPRHDDGARPADFIRGPPSVRTT